MGNTAVIDSHTVSAMAKKRILFTVMGGTLGHVKRSLTIARALRRRDAEVEISWLLNTTEASILREEGERILPESGELVDVGAGFAKRTKGYRFNLALVLGALDNSFRKNFDVIARVTRAGEFDLLVGDTTIEIDFGFRRSPASKSCPYVIVHDFAGLDAMSRNPLAHILCYYLNWSWVRSRDSHDLGIVLAQKEDHLDRRFGVFLPNIRTFTRETETYVGYVPSFDPDADLDRRSLRSRLGYGEEPLIICSVGGSAVGDDLLQLCADSYPLIRREIPQVRMVLICGPRIPTDSINAPGEVEVLGYVPSLYEHFAACDLAIVHGGGTGMLELTALRRPFIFFPLIEHGEQAWVARRAARWGAGVEMSFLETSPEQLTAAAIANIGREATYPPIAIDGAERAAGLICELLDRS